MKTTTTKTTLFSILVLTIALLPARLLAQESKINRTGEVQTNTGYQDFEGFLEQTIELAFGGEPATLTLPVGATAAVTLSEVASFIGLLGDELDMSSYIGILGDELDMSSQVKIRRLDQKRFALRGIGAGELSLQFKDKKGREAILKITVTEPEEQKKIEKE